MSQTTSKRWCERGGREERERGIIWNCLSRYGAVPNNANLLFLITDPCLPPPPLNFLVAWSIRPRLLLLSLRSLYSCHSCHPIPHTRDVTRCVEPCHVTDKLFCYCSTVCVCLLLQYLLQSCSRVGREIVKDMYYERRRTGPVWTCLPSTD